MKILCIPYSHTLSHVSRPLAVASELRDRGHEVSFAGESPKIEFIKSAGFKVYPVHEPDPEVLYGNIRAGKLRFVSDAEIERMVAADLALFREVQPDVVLTDGRFSAPISAQIHKVKHCAIVNVSSTAYRALPYIPFFDWLPSTVSRLLDGFNLTLEMTVFNNVMRIFTKLSKRYGLKKPVTATNCLTGIDLTLLADIPEYFPTINLPADYHYIGPLTWKSRLPQPPWWPPAPDTSPLVYITMGTTGVRDFFPRVHQLFAASELSAIITMGGQAANLKQVPGKIYVADYLDGDLAMEACNLVVCHGGNGTIYQALQHGKPVVGIPTIPDQQFNMRRVEALGLGKTLSWKEFSRNPQTLLQAVHEVCSENSCYRRAAEMRERILTYDPANQSANLIESLL